MDKKVKLKYCPFCDKEANSKHHIIPRNEGGIDEDRNTIWLCKYCHDTYEGLVITPRFIEIERIKLKDPKYNPREIYWVSEKRQAYLLGELQSPLNSVLGYTCNTPKGGVK